MNCDASSQNIPRVVKGFIVVIFSILLSCCSNLSKLEKDSFKEIEKLQNQFGRNTDNALYHIKLGSEYEKLGKANSSTFYYKKAIIEYKKAVGLEPNNTGLMFSLYQVMYLGVVDWFAEIDELVSLYNKIDASLRVNLNPPHFALFVREFARSSYGAVTEQQLEKLLYKSFSENPLNPQVSYFLSNFLISQKHYILGIDVLKRSLELQPENQLLNMQLGMAYESYAAKDYCPYEHQNELKKALVLLQQSAKLNPNNLRLNYTLSSLYERMNVPILMLDVAKKLVALDSGIDSKMELAEALSNVGRLDKSQVIYDELIRQGVKEAYISKAIAYAENGGWELSYAASKKYMERNYDLSVYSVLFHLALEEILAVESTPFNVASRHIKTLELDGWEKALFDYWYGAKSEKELSALANNICKQVESNFLFGVKKLQSKEAELALGYFEQIVDSETYSFVEFRIAEHLIKKLNN